MNKFKFSTLFNKSINLLIISLGTNVGTIISVLTLIGMGFTAGIYYNDYKKNIEILDIKKDYFIQIKELKNDRDKLEMNNEFLKNRIELINENKLNSKK